MSWPCLPNHDDVLRIINFQWYRVGDSDYSKRGELAVVIRYRVRIIANIKIPLKFLIKEEEICQSYFDDWQERVASYSDKRASSSLMRFSYSATLFTV